MQSKAVAIVTFYSKVIFDENYIYIVNICLIYIYVVYNA